MWKRDTRRVHHVRNHAQLETLFEKTRSAPTIPVAVRESPAPPADPVVDSSQHPLFGPTEHMHSVPPPRGPPHIYPEDLPPRVQTLMLLDMCNTTLHEVMRDDPSMPRAAAWLNGEPDAEFDHGALDARLRSLVHKSTD